MLQLTQNVKNISVIYPSNIIHPHIKHRLSTYQKSFVPYQMSRVHVSNVVCPHIRCHSSTNLMSLVHISCNIRSHVKCNASTPHNKCHSLTCETSFGSASDIFLHVSNISRPRITCRLSTYHVTFVHTSNVIHPHINICRTLMGTS